MTESSRASASADLLVELGCEELPPKALDGIRDAFFRGVCDGLEKIHIEFSRADSRSFSTPRRLAILLSDVSSAQPDQEIERRGPAVKAAFDADGKPTGAALGFARSVDKDVSELDTMKTDKGEWLYCRISQVGKSLDELLFPVLEQAIRQLPVPKPMRWAAYDFSFVRPVHWLVVLHGNRVIDGQLFGLDAGNLTRGHRIHSPGPHEIDISDRYEAVLEEAFVLADHETRREKIRLGLEEADTDVLIDPDLLREVNNLVEWPVPVSCSFEKEFLEVPHAALIASMQDHQKFFPVRESADSERVTNRFIAVSNLDSRDMSQVREGYERVIRPRLADARFFLEQDLKNPLEYQLKQLDRVVFQQKIGTVGDKSKRISELSHKLAEVLSQDPEHSARAALLSKCDLMTHMVGEFPELQGMMGRHYALSSGENGVVADAIGEHYAPKFAGDRIPATEPGRIVSIADRLDTLVGIFAAGLKPSGNKDPFALRRSALGLLRILLEANLPLSLRDAFDLAAGQFEGQLEIEEGTIDDLLGFVVDRLRHYYTEQGYRTELVNAVLASPWKTLPDLERRLQSINAFMGGDAAVSLAASNKRIGNILRKTEFDSSMKIDTELLNIDEERYLFDEVIRIETAISPLLDEGRYDESLQALAALKEPVDRFFDEVMVMDEDPALRANRLALLAYLKAQFDQIADLSILG
jgi:glycyl-tRNA synthetase beta chain